MYQVYLFIYLTSDLPMCRFGYQSFVLSVCLSFCLPAFVCIYLSTYLSIHLVFLSAMFYSRCMSLTIILKFYIHLSMTVCMCV